MKSQKTLPKGIERHIGNYFQRCGKVKKVFSEGSKCYVEFASESQYQEAFERDEHGNVIFILFLFFDVDSEMNYQ